jgi:hypothetical protein
MYENEEAENCQDEILQLRMIIHDDGHHANVRKETTIEHMSNDECDIGADRCDTLELDQ